MSATVPFFAAEAASETLFGKPYYEIADPAAAPKWQDAEAAVERDRHTLAQCAEGAPCETPAVRAWRRLIAAAAADPRGPLTAVNTLVNDRVAEVPDYDIYGQADYWASPLETLTRGRGDCEDLAILKMATLAELGVPADKLRLIVVRLRRRAGLNSDMHAVVLADGNQDQVVLDSLRDDLVAARQTRAYTPVYGIRLLAGARSFAMAPRAADAASR